MSTPPQADLAHPRKRGRAVGSPPELKLTSMIDIVFLLLVFFVITASFVEDEGSILVTLPGNTSDTAHSPEIKPTVILLQLVSAGDGVGYTLTANGQAIDGGATALYDYLQQRTAADVKHADRVDIKPSGDVRWQHVVNVYNACVRAELETVGFVPAS